MLSTHRRFPFHGVGLSPPTMPTTRPTLAVRRTRSTPGQPATRAEQRENRAAAAPQTCFGADERRLPGLSAEWNPGLYDRNPLFIPFCVRGPQLPTHCHTARVAV